PADLGLERLRVLVFLDDHGRAAHGALHPLPRLVLAGDEHLAARADQLVGAGRDADVAALGGDAGEDLLARLRIEGPDDPEDRGAGWAGVVAADAVGRDGDRRAA